MEKNHYRDKSFNIFLSCAFFLGVEVGGGEQSFRNDVIIWLRCVGVALLLHIFRMLSDANLILTVCLCVFGLNEKREKKRKAKLLRPAVL